jgi:site-specific DNA-methyltransferase (adenine-specific)
MKHNVRLAFEAVSRSYSPDRVVADPELNLPFLARCRELGLSENDSTLNRALLNLRKQGGLRGLHSKRSSFPREDSYRFAADIAARFIERRDGVSLDDIICDPERARELDVMASRISPGFSSVEYRWAALNLRKASRLKPEILGRVVQAQAVQTFQLSDLDVSLILPRPGLYIFYSCECVLYVGEAENLNNRIRKHLEHSDNKGLARWMWEEGKAKLSLEIHTLPQGTPTRVRRALETELIRSRQSVFNVKR